MVDYSTSFVCFLFGKLFQIFPFQPKNDNVSCSIMSNSTQLICIRRTNDISFKAQKLIQKPMFAHILLMSFGSCSRYRIKHISVRKTYNTEWRICYMRTFSYIIWIFSPTRSSICIPFFTIRPIRYGEYKAYENPTDDSFLNTKCCYIKFHLSPHTFRGKHTHSTLLCIE